MKFYSSIAFKFILIITTLVLIPGIFIGVSLINITRQTMETYIQEIHTKQVEAVKNKIDERISGIYSIISAIIRSKVQIDLAYEKNMLAILYRISNNILCVYTADNAGKVSLETLASTTNIEIPINISKDELFIKARDEKKMQKSGIEYFNNQPGLRIIIPFSGNKFLIVIIDFRDIYENIKSTRFGGTGIVFLMDSKSDIVLHPDKKKEGRNLGKTKLAEQIANSSTGSTEYTLDGNMMIGAYSALDKLQFTIVTQQLRQEAYKAVLKMRQNAIIIMTVSVLIAIFIGVLLARGLTLPLLKITAVAKNVAEGNYGALVEVKTRDEINLLANTFNIMSRKIKQFTDMQIEKILLEKAKLEAILFSISDGVIMTDYSGNILHLNESAKKMFNVLGYKDFENIKIYDVLKSEKIKNEVNAIINSQDKHVVHEVDISDSNLTKILKMEKNEVKSPKDDSALGLMMVVHDITLEKEIEKMKEDFIHSITHDLRTPMTSIRGFLEFLKDGTVGPLNEQQAKFINIIDRSSLKLLGMINDILDVAKLESGKMQIELEKTNIIEVIKKVVETLTPQATDAEIELSFEIQPDLPEIMADSDLIERTITNLTGNALKFTPHQGKITLSAIKENNGLQVSIADTGEGMPAEFLDRIFSKFQQSSAKHRKKGTGLGLTICKYVVEAHLGKIWVESELGRGSKFIFWLPENLITNSEGKIEIGTVQS